MNILINKAHFPVYVLGYGKRIGIWLQGCSIRCHSCCSLDTWEFDDDHGMDVAALVEWCRQISTGDFDGVTISGGEPFDQPDALLELLKALTLWRSEKGGQFDILVYSGYSDRHVEHTFAVHLKHLDAVVAGPFRQSAGREKSYCGSDNQQMVICSAIAAARYGLEGLAGWKSGMQVATDDAGIWMIGIPRPGDLEEFESGCLQRGLVLENPSWRC
jgi:anaerobic ribonucleoside-triphosphate reductase activating protein